MRLWCVEIFNEYSLYLLQIYSGMCQRKNYNNPSIFDESIKFQSFVAYMLTGNVSDRTLH